MTASEMAELICKDILKADGVTDPRTQLIVKGAVMRGFIAGMDRAAQIRDEVRRDMQEQRP